MKVFVVHGRNLVARDALVDWLKRHDVEVPGWVSAVGNTNQGTPSTWEVVKQGLDTADFVVVLFTPDEVVYLHPDLAQLNDPELQPKGQARPNVYLEAGYALAKDEARVVLVEMGEQSIASDLAGKNTVRLNPSIEAQQNLLTRLRLDIGLVTVEDLTLSVPVFALPAAVDTLLDGDGDTVRGQAPVKQKGASAFYSVFPVGSTNREIEKDRDIDTHVVTWAISRDRIRATRGPRMSQTITPLDFSYILDGAKYEKTLELID